MNTTSLSVLVAAGENSDGPSGVDLILPAAYDILWSAVIFLVIVAVFMWKILPKLQKVLDDPQG